MECLVYVTIIHIAFIKKFVKCCLVVTKYFIP